MKLSMPEAKKTSPARKILFTAVILALAAIGAFYWHSSGRMVLQGAVSGALLPVQAEISGQVSKTLASEGDLVAKGQGLVQLENSALKETYLREEQARLQMEASIPPQALADNGALKEELTLRLEQESLAEQAAHSFLQEASTEEARAAVALRRATIQHGEKRISDEQYQEAQLAHNRAKRLLEAARIDQERASLARAGTTTELRRIRNTSASGHDEASASLLKAYELQSLKAYAAADALNASIIRAPHAGVVAGLTTQPGAFISAGETALFLLPVSVPPSIVIYATAEDAAKLQPGMACSVAIPASAAGPFDGEIAAVLPNMQMNANEIAGPDGKSAVENLPFRVHVRLSGVEGVAASTNATNANSAPLPFIDGSRAEVTVYLHKPGILGTKENTGAAKTDTGTAPEKTSGGEAPAKSE